MIDWIGCKLTKCPYGKEYGNCDTCVNLIRATEMVKPVLAFPENPTNGDMIRTVFPNASIEVRNISVYVDLGNIVGFSRRWWDAPYEQRGEQE